MRYSCELKGGNILSVPCTMSESDKRDPRILPAAAGHLDMLRALGMP